MSGLGEGSLQAPTRHPIDWRKPEYYDEGALFKELERVFDICHGCRRCFSLCNAFPTLFDAVDASPTMEVNGVERKVYWQVVDHCYLCDMCYMTKCPYVPPHPWNVDFPHLMLRAKAIKHAQGRTRLRDRILSATDAVGRIAGIPVVTETVNAVNRSRAGRKLLEKTLGVHAEAPVPVYQRRSFRQQNKAILPPHPNPLPLKGERGIIASPASSVSEERATVSSPLSPVSGERARVRGHVQPTADTRGKVALFVTCYANRIEPDLAADLIAVFEHNGIPVVLVPQEKCCGMPKLELGDLEAIEKLKNANVPVLAALIDEGYDIVAPVPSCVLMFKQELPLMFPDEPQVARVKEHLFDPFEYLMLRHKAGLLNTEFRQALGTVAYHVPCHLRVQNIGLKTREVLGLVPGTTFETIERCSGHNGTYAVKQEFHETSMRIGRPVVQKVQASGADRYASDCPMAGRQIEHGLKDGRGPTHPLKLLRIAYGI